MTQTITREEEEILIRAREQLIWDSRLGASDIDVRVSGDTVTLTGTVQSYAARLFAETDVTAIMGVRRVINELAIKFPASLDLPDDRRIERTIDGLIRLNARLAGAEITVAAANGMVILEGTVDSFWKKMRAESLAAEVRGVTGIHNKLSVVPTRSVTDEIIAQNITAALDRNISIELDLIEIEVSNGRVTLGGSVPDRITYHAVEQIARHTEGVTDVVNYLLVERPRPNLSATR